MQPSSYEIRVSGLLPPELLADFAAMTASVQPVSTVVYGALPSQAHLQALMARLELFGARVLEVRCLRTSGEPEPQGGQPVPDPGL